MSFVYRKKSRESQKYRILYDDGTTMESLEEQMEASPEGDEDAYSEESTDFDNETEAQAEDREDLPPRFDPRDVEGRKERTGQLQWKSKSQTMIVTKMTRRL
jgi:hypothetical protein